MYSTISRSVLSLCLPLLCTTVAASLSTCKSAAHALVSGSNGVHDVAITASSVFDKDHGAHRARLNTVSDDISPFGAWCPSQADMKKSWIQVQFEEDIIVEKIQTQGRSDIQYPDYTTQYTVSTSYDCFKFAHYKEDGQVKIFNGNYDQNTVVTQSLKYPQVARCVQIHVSKYNRWPCLRFEIVGGKACPTGYRRRHHSCYKLIKEKFPWAMAAAYCKLEGGKLAAIETAAENSWLRDYLMEQDSPYITVKHHACNATTLTHAIGKTEDCYYLCTSMLKCNTFVTSKSSEECWMMSCFKNNLTSSQSYDTNFIISRTEDIWMNLNRVSNQDEWVTEPDTPAKFYNWAHKQPDDHHLKNCGALSPSNKYGWTSKPCSSQVYFVCETPLCNIRK